MADQQKRGESAPGYHHARHSLRHLCFLHLLSFSRASGPDAEPSGILRQCAAQRFNRTSVLQQQRGGDRRGKATMLKAEHPIRASIGEAASCSVH
jgi:hypothetical protein